MINTSITYSLPKVNSNLTGTMKRVENAIKASVMETLVTGGRQRWQPLQPNVFGRTQAFYPPNRLAMSVVSRSGEDFAEVSAGAGLRYAMAQHQGSVNAIPITMKSRKFFWVMFHRTGDPKWKNMALSSKDRFIIRIPPRPFVMFQMEDIENIIKLIGDGIIKFEDMQGSVTVGNA